jgi:RimJ/RimL family protein N-acetyltransferase
MPNILSLRPLQPSDLPWQMAMRNSEEAVGSHNWVGPTDEALLTKQVNTDITTPNSQSHGTLVVELSAPDGSKQPIGDISWRTERWGPSPESQCPALGISLLPAFRGLGFGSLAQKLLVDYLFSTYEINRVQSDTAVDNPAEQRALEKAGFVREGVVRQGEFRAGRYHDHVLYSVLRQEWATAKSKPTG